jgi:class 3 adenylate cyclase
MRVMAAAELASPPAGTWTIERLLREHPWPAAYAGKPRLEWLWVIDVALAPAELWPLVSDLSRLNRALGNPELRFGEKNGVRVGSGRYGGLAHEWEEVAWDWVAGQWFAFDRIYRRGGMTALHAIHRLVPGGAGTRLHVYFGVTPRWRILAPALRASFAALGRAYRRVVPALAAEANAGKEMLSSAPKPGLTAQGSARLAAAVERLRREDGERAVVDRLVELVRGGDDLDVARLQARVLARRWGLDEDAVLRGFLHATRAGLLELTWDVVCPHCRGVRASETRLAAVPKRGGCEACAIEFGTSEAVEVGFRIHPSIRDVPVRQFCSAEPSTKPHIELQRALPAGATATVEVDLAPGRYRLRGRGDGPTGTLDVRDQAGDLAGSAPVAWRQSAPPADQPAPPHAALELINDAADARTFVLERAAPFELALRPGRVLSDPDFRALFSEDFLGDDVRLAVGEQTLLFTDIVGSTAMYAERGDPAAFTSVRHHFTETFALVGEHRGVVVKTIGDATMAAFVDPVDALAAAVALQRAFADPAGIRLRVSLNTGTCIAVRLNADIDYFGHAVNVAAKLQCMVEAGQVVLADRTHAAPGVADALAATGLAVEELAVAIKGIAASTRAFRFTVS